MNNLADFKDYIWHFYKENKRHFAWRNIDNPYYVVVSEIMLQQTQTHRVIEKYIEFIAAFPTFGALAQASLRDVLQVWQGLGYYRRARFLHQLATIVVNEYDGVLPDDSALLQKLPGIGSGTAGSIGAFAFNKPTVFIETNIRTVFIYHFFYNEVDITDKMLFPLIAATVDRDNPREWYYALMDYGVYLKSQQVNPSRKSAHYSKQSAFVGSDRQIRAKILKLVVQGNGMAHDDIISTINQDRGRVQKIIDKLVAENFIQKTINDIYLIM